MQRATRLDDPQLVGIYETLGVPAAMRPRNRLLETTELDVVVTIARDTWLRNSVMNVEVYTPEDADPLHVTIDHATRAYVFEGVIHADRWWYPERAADAEDPFGWRTTNINVCTEGARQDCDAVLGTWLLRGLPCRIEKDAAHRAAAASPGESIA